MSGRQPRCTLGLLSWNGARDVAACVNSILAQTEPALEIIWVDNASTDATRRIVAETFPGFPQPRVMARNMGFCGGHNLAFQASGGKYYLALNQDAFLAPDYVSTLCDWMDADPSLALASGLILKGDAPGDANAPVYSSGMAMGRGRFPFELGRDGVPAGTFSGRRVVPAVTGAAMMIRREAVAAMSPDTSELFPPDFFAYFEEVDLALRAAEAGFTCGVDGSALAWHAERGRGGIGNPAVHAHYLKNHWLLSARHDSLGEFARDLPAILRGELLHYAPKYFRSPGTALDAVAQCIRLLPAARNFRRWLLSRHPNAPRGRRKFYDTSRALLRAGRAS